jgi:hypothetical protein
LAAHTQETTMKARSRRSLAATFLASLMLLLAACAEEVSDDGGEAGNNEANNATANNATANNATANNAANNATTNNSTPNNGGSGDGFSADVDFPKSSAMNSLTNDQQIELCEQFKAYSEEQFLQPSNKEALCTVQGIVRALFEGGGDPAVCVTTRDQCVAAPVEGEDTPCEPQPDCGASVSELEDCVNEQIETLTGLASEVTCDLVTDQAKLQELFNQQQTKGPACQIVEAVCPSFFPEEE